MKPRSLFFGRFESRNFSVSQASRKVRGNGILAKYVPLSVSLAVTGMSPFAQATAITWDAGGANTNWSDFNNFSDNLTPTGDNVTFNNTGALASGTTVTSTVDTSFTIASLVFQQDSTTPNHTMSISSGQTLSVTGSVTPANGAATAVLFGNPVFASALTNNLTTLTGTGTLTVTNSAAHFLVGASSSGTTTGTATVDMSGLAAFNATVSIFGVGKNSSLSTGTPATRSATGVLTLSKTSNITADQISIGDSQFINSNTAFGGTGGGASSLNLGSGGSAVNNLYADNIYLGAGKTTSGTLQFAAGVVASDKVTIRAKNGTSAVTLVELGAKSHSGASSNFPVGTVNFGVGQVDALITTLRVARWAPGANQTAAVNGTSTFDTGTNASSNVAVTTLDVATNGSTFTAFGSSNMTGTVNVSGGVFSATTVNLATGTGITNLTRTANLNVDGGTFRFGSFGTPVGTANINFKSGAVSSIDSTARSLSLNYNLGKAAGSTVTFGQASGGTGTLSLGGTGTLLGNTTVEALVSTTLGGAIGGGFSLTKTGGSTLTLSVGNSYSGGTTINNGTLVAGSSTALGSGPLAIGSNGTLSTGNLSVGAITLSGGGNILLGGVANTITSSGAVGISGTGNLLTLGGSAATAGNTYTLLSGTSLSAAGISLTGTAVGNSTITLGSSSTVGRTNYAFNATSTALQLAVTGGAFNLKWNGGNANWNTTDANWQKDGAGSNITFFTADNITISTSDSIAVDAGGVSAGTLLVNNATGTATLSGGNLAASSLAMSGAGGVLSINNATTLLGAATVSAGTLALDASGSLTATGVAVSGGILDIGANNKSLANVSLTSGSITGTSGVLTGTGSAFDLQLGNVSAILGGSLGLTKTTSGTVTLSGANNYTGTTAVNNGTLAISGSGTLGNGAALTLGGGTLDLGATSQTVGAVSITAAAGSGNTLENGSIAGTSYAASNTTGNALVTANLLVNGSAGLAKTGAGTITLSGTNTYTGTTAVNGGTVAISGSGTLGNGAALTLGGGTLNLGATSQTVGAVSITAAAASGNTLENGSISGTSYAASNTAGTALVTANLMGSAGLTKSGAGALTLSGVNTYTGTTSVTAGTLSLSNKLGSIGTPSGAISVSGATLNISGEVYAPSLTLTNSGTSTISLTTGGAVTLSGAFTVNAGNNNVVGLASLTGGTLAANSMAIGRTTLNVSSVQSSGTTSHGVYINGATVNIATTLGIGNISGTNSSANLRMDSGSLTVGGTTVITIGGTGNSRLSMMDISGGTFTSNDTTGAGIQIGGDFSTSNAELLVRGTGIVNANKITLGNATQTNNSAVLELLGGTTYLGSGGIVLGTATPAYTPVVHVGGTAYTTAPTLAANADWSSSVNMTLTNSSSAVAPIFKAADASNVAHNITLTGVLSGAGGLTKTGGGILSIGGASANTYNGTTTINAGTVQTTGNVALGNVNNGLTVNTGGTLDLASTSQGVGALNGTGGTILNGTNATASTLTVGNNNATGASYAGVIVDNAGGGATGTIALTKTGTGTLALTGTNTYTGATTINAGGTLSLGSTGSIANSTIIAANGTLDVSAVTGGTWTVGATQSLVGAGTITGSTASNEGVFISGTHSAGNGIGTQTVNADLTYNSGSIFSWDLNVAASNAGSVSQNGLLGSAYDGATVSGDLGGSAAVFKIVLGAGESFADNFWGSNRTWSNIFTSSNSDWASIFTTMDYSAVGGAPDLVTQGSFTLTGSTLSWSAVPEPTSSVAGLLLAAGLLRRRRA